MMKNHEVQSPVLTGKMVEGRNATKKQHLERILEEIQDFQNENNHQLDDIKDKRIGETEEHIDAVETRLLTME